MQAIDQSYPTLANASELELLLKGFNTLNVKSASYTPTACGAAPLRRSIRDYLKYGIINLDKTAGPSSHEVVAWVKRILEVEKTGHSGTLDPMVTGCLLVCIDRATRLVKQQQEMGKEYVCIVQFKDVEAARDPLFPSNLRHALETLTCAQLQRPPAEGVAVKRVLRVREIYKSELYEVDPNTGRAVFHVSCQAGTYIRTLCVHLGLLLGHEAYMLELRRVRSGNLTEHSNLSSLHDVLDSYWLMKNLGDESYIRKVVMPLETLLVGMKRIFVKDSCVNAITYGSPLLIPGVVRYENGIGAGDSVVLVTTKGEAIALGTAKMSTVDIAGCNHGIVATLKRVIMDRDVYDKQWSLGPVAKERKTLIAKGLLDKYGAPNDKTPKEWLEKWADLDAFLKTAGNTCLNSTDAAVPEQERSIPMKDVAEEDVLAGRFRNEEPVVVAQGCTQEANEVKETNSRADESASQGDVGGQEPSEPMDAETDHKKHKRDKSEKKHSKDKSEKKHSKEKSEKRHSMDKSEKKHKA